MKALYALLAVSAGVVVGQTPATTEILNNYGLANPGTVAQGAIFIVKGTNLSDQTTTLQSVPLQTTLVGVRLELTVAGTTTFAPMYYALPTQLGGILPSNTPTGSGTLIVRNNGRSSSPRAITVVRSAFGMLTLNGSGTGAAAVHNDAYILLNSANATNPGKAVIFYGSGLGPTPANETVEQSGGNASGDLTSIPITVTVGGKAAQVLYRGRTIFPGLDQINVMMPALDVYGCEIPVAITTNGVQANAGTIPVAASGAACPPPATSGGGGSPSLTAAEIDTFVARGFYTSGGMSLHNSITYSAAGTLTRTNSVAGLFTRTSGADLGRMLRNQLPPGFPIQPITPGNCLVYNSTQLYDPYPLITRVNLDAGAQLTAAGPNGSQNSPRLNIQVAGPTYNTPNNFPNTFVVPGRYALSGPGGSQVGGFSGTLDVVQDFVLTNPTNFVTAINRGAPLTISWSGGDPSTVLTIQGSSFVGSVATVFQCIESVSAGQFTVPASILSQLPAAPAGSPIPGSFIVTVAGAGTRLPTPSGLDIMTAFNFWNWQFSPSFQ
jgi:uncharacterized protein (TIGR03437 family)